MYEEIEIEQADGSFEKHVIKHIGSNNVICFPAQVGNPNYDEYLKVKEQNV